MGVHPPVSTLSSDASVIALSLSRPEAFATIFERHFSPVHAYLSRRVGATRADDLSSATFMVAFERRRSFRSNADSARPWLLGIATNLLRNERRAERRAVHALMTRQQDLSPGGSEADAAQLAVGLAELDAEQRDVLLLYAWADLSYEQIAVSLGIPLGTVRSRLARARQKLSARLSRTTNLTPSSEVSDDR